MKNWKTTVGGLVSGLAMIFGGLELIRQGETEKGALAVVAGAGLIFKGWHAVDKV